MPRKKKNFFLTHLSFIIKTKNLLKTFIYKSFNCVNAEHWIIIKMENFYPLSKIGSRKLKLKFSLSNLKSVGKIKNRRYL